MICKTDRLLFLYVSLQFEMWLFIRWITQFSVFHRGEIIFVLNSIAIDRHINNFNFTGLFCLCSEKKTVLCPIGTIHTETLKIFCLNLTFQLSSIYINIIIVFIPSLVSLCVRYASILFQYFQWRKFAFTSQLKYRWVNCIMTTVKYFTGTAS